MALRRCLHPETVDVTLRGKRDYKFSYIKGSERRNCPASPSQAHCSHRGSDRRETGRSGAEGLGQGGMARRPGAGSLQPQAEEGAGASPEPRERTSPADTQTLAL